MIGQSLPLVWSLGWELHQLHATREMVGDVQRSNTEQVSLSGILLGMGGGKGGGSVAAVDTSTGAAGGDR